MKKKLSFLIVLTLVFISLLGVGSRFSANAYELTDEEKITQELNNIVVPEKAILDFPVVSNSAYGSMITWESSNIDVLNVPTEGGWVVVTRPTDKDAVVTLTVTLERNGARDSKNFSVLVPKGETQTNTYNITYHLNGGTNHVDNPTSYKVGTTPAVYAPTKGTVEFLGWYDNATFEGNAITVLPKGLSGDYHLYAKWGTPVVTDIQIKTNPTKTTYKALENFDATGLVVEAVYNDGTTKELVLSELSFDKTVLHGNDTTVEVTYGTFHETIEVTVEKLEYDLSDFVFESDSKVYNGLTQVLSYSGTLPEGLTVKEVTGGGKNASTTAYDVVLTFDNANEVDYVTPNPMTVQLTIIKTPLTVTADSKMMMVGGTLPTFTASYSGFVNGETETVLGGTLAFDCDGNSTKPAGEYTITPKGLTSDNYEITFVNGTLTINSGEYTIYVDSSELSKVYNGSAQSFTALLKDGDRTIEGIEFSYTENGSTFLGATNVGKYSILVSYNDDTYGAGSVTIQFEITKATYDMSGIKFVDATLTYTGALQNLQVIGTLPVGVSVSYSAGLTNVGTVTVTASFTGDSLNYEAIPNMTAELTIVAKELSIAMFEAIPSQSYTGSPVEPELVGTYNGNTLVKDVDYTAVFANNVEQGTATVTLTGKGNYSGEIVLTFVIGDTDLSKVQDAREELETTYADVFTGVLSGGLDPLMVTSSNDCAIFWLSSSTAMSVNPETGKVTVILTETLQTIVLYALITRGEAVEYASFNFTLPARDVLVDETTLVEVEGAGNNLTLNVEAIPESNLGNFVVQEGQTTIQGFDITLFNALNIAVQPNSKVLVRIPVLAGHENDTTLKVYHVGGDGTLEEVSAVVENGYLVFETTSFSEYIVTSEQKEEIKTLTIKEMLAAEVSETFYQVTGIVRNVTDTGYGNFDLVDAFDETIKIYVYGLRPDKDANKSNSQWKPLGINEGDTLTLIGKRGEYNTTIEIMDAYYVSHEKTEWLVYAESTDATKGTVEVSKDIVQNGEKVTLTFTPAEGYQVSSLKINGGNEIMLSGTTYELTVTEDVEIEVLFVEEGTVVTKEWQLVTSLSQLAIGDTIVIAAKDPNIMYALGTTQSTNNRKAAAITEKDNFDSNPEVQLITLEAGLLDDTFAFQTGAGYLYAAGGTGKNNYLKTQTVLSEAGSWLITITTDGTASIVAQGNVLRNTLMYNPNTNNGDPLFSCYASGQKDVCIYRLAGEVTN